MSKFTEYLEAISENNGKQQILNAWKSWRNSKKGLISETKETKGNSVIFITKTKIKAAWIPVTLSTASKTIGNYLEMRIGKRNDGKFSVKTNLDLLYSEIYFAKYKSKHFDSPIEAFECMIDYIENKAPEKIKQLIKKPR